MQHLYEFEQFNTGHINNHMNMAFLTSNSAAGTQGAEGRLPGSTPNMTSPSDYTRNLANAFNDFNISFRKTKQKKRHRKIAQLFLRHKRK